MNKPDLIGYLFSEYNKELDKQESELTDEAKAMFDSFIAFCRFQLRMNPAVSLCILEQGLGLKLADSGEVALVDMAPLRSQNYGSMPVTNPGLFAANSGITGVSAVPIFGGDQK